MKKSILTILALLPIWAFAQKQDSTIFNGTKKIVLLNKATAKENYLAAGESLVSLEYKIGKKDTEFNQLSSEPLTIEGTNYYRQLVLEVTAKDNQIIITPKTKRLNNLMGELGPKETFEPTPFTKNKLSKDVYLRLEKLARAIGGKIIYSE
ncbi:hypothetical protein DBR40_21915 [Pedobacter sp. KBW01]|uniref:hypothetical protein n=1 Tax=Pedobacter sp. KBW01 TaxID=2153364 RepID=UPI000F5B2AD5|nr:hypothetical protein [Pedobacter sp. KBW01]RQO66810.1 hypothetical protein DBR40_21915 [Pedobacter sp. KBW01]